MPMSRCTNKYTEWPYCYYEHPYFIEMAQWALHKWDILHIRSIPWTSWEMAIVATIYTRFDDNHRRHSLLPSFNKSGMEENEFPIDKPMHIAAVRMRIYSDSAPRSLATHALSRVVNRLAALSLSCSTQSAVCLLYRYSFSTAFNKCDRRPAIIIPFNAPVRILIAALVVVGLSLAHFPFLRVQSRH